MAEERAGGISGCSAPSLGPSDLAAPARPLNCVLTKESMPMRLVQADNIGFMPMLAAISEAFQFGFEPATERLTAKNDILGTIVCSDEAGKESSRHVVRCRSVELATEALDAAATELPSEDSARSKAIGEIAEALKAHIETKLKGLTLFFDRPDGVEDDAQAAVLLMAQIVDEGRALAAE